MKSEVKTASPEAKELKFPLLARSKVSNAVVLFTDIEAGLVVKSSGTFHSVKLGRYSTCWIDCDDANKWEILPPGSTVTLTQE